MNIYVVQDSDRMAHCERSTSRSTSRLELWECGTDEVTKHNTVHMDVCTYLWVYTYGWMYIYMMGLHLHGRMEWMYCTCILVGQEKVFTGTEYSGHTPMYIGIGHSLHYWKYTPHTQSPEDHSQHTTLDKKEVVQVNTYTRTSKWM